MNKTADISVCLIIACNTGITELKSVSAVKRILNKILEDNR